jgi:hypothetical protein
MDNQLETLDSTNEQIGEVNDTTETVDTSEESAQLEQSTRREFSQYEKDLYGQLKAEKARTEKLKAELEAKSAPQQIKKAVSSTADGLPSREEYLADILKVSKGFNDEDISDARLISNGKGLSITDAVNTEEFAALKKLRDDRKEIERAGMRASKGSQPKAKVSISSPSLSDDEHKRLFLERNT